MGSGFKNSPTCTSLLTDQGAAIKVKKTHKVKAVYIKGGRRTMCRAMPIQNLDPQALTRGLLQALRGIVYKELWVGWVRLVSVRTISVQKRGCYVLLGCSWVAMKGPTLVLCNNWGVRQLSCMTSQGFLVGVARSCLHIEKHTHQRILICISYILINFTSMFLRGL